MRACLVALLLIPLLCSAAPGGEDQAAIDRRVGSSGITLDPQEQAWLREHPVIRVSNEMDWAPFDFVEQGQPAGYSIDLMNLVADRLGIRFEYVNGMTWSELLEAFRAGEIDLMSAINYSDSRTSFARFTEPYFANAIGLFSQKDLEIDALSDLEGMTVALPEGYAVLEELQKEVSTIRHLKTNDIVAAIQAVAAGKADYTLESAPMIQHLINKHGIPNLRLSFFPEFREYGKKYIGLRAATHVDNPMLGRVVQKALNSITFEEKEQLRKKWLGDITQQPTRKIPLTTQEREWLRKHPIIRVSNEMDFPPYDFVQNGRPAGYNIDLIDLLVDRIGMDVEYVNGYPWSELIALFRDGKLDLLHAVKVTPERQKIGLFSKPYRRLKTHYVTTDGSEDIRSIRDLYGKKFAVGKAWFHEEYLKKQHPRIELLRFDNMLQMLEAVADGEADVTAASRDVLEYFINKYGLTELTIGRWAREMDGAQAYTHHFMGQQDAPELISMLNKALDSLTVEELDRLNQKWFGGSTDLNQDAVRIALTQEEKAYLREKGALKKCARPSYVPLEWIDEDGEHQGIASTLSDKLSDLIDVPIELHPTKTWEASLNAGRNRQCDMFTVIAATPERQAFLNFTDTFLRIPIVIVTQIQTPYFENMTDLEGKKLGVVRISNYNETLRDEYPDLIWTEVEDIEEGLAKVSQGELYGFVDSMTSVAYRIQRDAIFDLKIAGRLKQALDFKVGARSDEPLLVGILQKAVKALDEQEKRGIINQWVAVKFEEKINYQLLWEVLVVGTLIIMGTIYWNRRLATVNMKFRQANELLEETQKIAKLGSWEYDISKAKVSWSKEVFRIAGMEGRDNPPTFQEYLDTIHIDDRGKLIENLKMARSGEPYELELRHLKSDGSYNYTLTRAKPLIRNGVVVKIQGTVLDLTRLRQTELALKDEMTRRLSYEESLRASEERFRSIVEAGSDWIWEVDTEGRYTYASAHVKHTLGYDPEELIGKTPFDLMPDNEAERVKNFFADILSKKQQFKYFTNENLHKNGHRVVLESSANPIFNAKGELLGYRGVDRDITERIAFQETLQKAKTEAESANRAKSEFLANMSHEIRTPLNAVIGFSELLEKTEVTPRQANYLSSIKTGGKTLLGIIEDILDLSKIEAGKIKIANESVNVNRLLTDIREVFSFKVKEKGLNFSLAISGEIPEHLMLDETRLRQVLFNLVGNAVKFTHVGSIEILADIECVEERTTDLIITVKDTGVGIPEDQQETVFESFEQQEGQSNRQYGGTGLGLAICKKLVKLMGGKIRLKSLPGEGSTFTVHLHGIAIPSTQAREAPAAAGYPRGITFEPATVLVVDDVDSNRRLVKNTLEDSGLRVVEAADGGQAMGFCEEEKPDLVLMDIGMPVMDGITATRQIRQNPALADITVVALTASPWGDRRGNDFQGYLEKPITPGDLITELQKYLVHRVRKADWTEESPADNWSVAEQQEILEILDQSTVALWTEAMETGVFDDARTFGEALHTLGTTHRIKPLVRYARAILESVDRFDVQRLQNLLLRFANLRVSGERVQDGSYS